MSSLSPLSPPLPPPPPPLSVYFSIEFSLCLSLQCFPPFPLHWEGEEIPRKPLGEKILQTIELYCSLYKSLCESPHFPSPPPLPFVSVPSDGFFWIFTESMGGNFSAECRRILHKAMRGRCSQQTSPTVLSLCLRLSVSSLREDFRLSASFLPPPSPRDFSFFSESADFLSAANFRNSAEKMLNETGKADDAEIFFLRETQRREGEMGENSKKSPQKSPPPPLSRLSLVDSLGTVGEALRHSLKLKIPIDGILFDFGAEGFLQSLWKVFLSLGISVNFTQSEIPKNSNFPEILKFRLIAVVTLREEMKNTKNTKNSKEIIESLVNSLEEINEIQDTSVEWGVLKVFFCVFLLREIPSIRHCRERLVKFLFSLSPSNSLNVPFGMFCSDALKTLRIGRIDEIEGGEGGALSGAAEISLRSLQFLWKSLRNLRGDFLKICPAESLDFKKFISKRRISDGEGATASRDGEPLKSKKIKMESPKEFPSPPPPTVDVLWDSLFFPHCLSLSLPFLFISLDSLCALAESAPFPLPPKSQKTVREAERKFVNETLSALADFALSVRRFFLWAIRLSAEEISPSQLALWNSLSAKIRGRAKGKFQKTSQATLNTVGKSSASSLWALPMNSLTEKDTQTETKTPNSLTLTNSPSNTSMNSEFLGPFREDFLSSPSSLFLFLHLFSLCFLFLSDFPQRAALRKFSSEPFRKLSAAVVGLTENKEIQREANPQSPLGVLWDSLRSLLGSLNPPDAVDLSSPQKSSRRPTVSHVSSNAALNAFLRDDALISDSEAEDDDFGDLKDFIAEDSEEEEEGEEGEDDDDADSQRSQFIK